jgi:hypothetical protein
MMAGCRPLTHVHRPYHKIRLYVGGEGGGGSVSCLSALLSSLRIYNFIIYRFTECPVAIYKPVKVDTHMESSYQITK